MKPFILFPIVQNAAMLLVLSVIFEGFYLFPLRRRKVQSVVIGVLIALFCVTIMAMPYEAEPGVRLDTRTILISVTALIFGFIPTIIASAAAIFYRLFVGGVGATAGIMTVVTSAVIGLVWRHWIDPKVKKNRLLSTFIMNVVVHVVMLLCVLIIPYPQNFTVIGEVAFTVLLIYPITASLLCALLLRQIETRGLQEKLAQSEKRFRVLFEQAPIGYQSLDKDANVIHVNQQWLEMFGYARDDVAGQWMGEFIAPEYMDEFRRKFERFKEQGTIQCELGILSKDSRLIYVNEEGKILYDEKGEFQEAHCVTQDITARKEAQKKLRASEQKYGEYISNAPNGVLVIDEAGKIYEVNNATSRMTGYSQEELLNMSVLDITLEKTLGVAVYTLNNLQIMSTANNDMLYLHKNGQERWANVSAVKLSENRFLCFMSDVTEQKNAMEKVLYTSTHDGMTGLWNRQYFEMEAERLDAPEQLPLSVLVGDINGLKLINDSFGHAEGDRVIVETAKFFSGFCREGDVLARTGGDDFSILLPQTDQTAAMEMLRHIQDACEEHNKNITDDLLHINLSLAAATKQTQEEAFAEVYKRAETIMHQRKLLEIKSSHSSIIAMIRATMREKSNETEAHEERMAKMARKVGRIMGLSANDLDNIELLAQLHDIGKVGISEQILNKPGKLTPEEWVEMKKHPEIGERIAMSISSLAPIAQYILCHHERWNGTGYPQQLAGEDIPLLSRIISIVDSYDAMTENRVYQKAMTHEEALAEIRRNAGTQFDPEIARIFCEEVFQNGKDKLEDEHKNGWNG